MSPERMALIDAFRAQTTGLFALPTHQERFPCFVLAPALALQAAAKGGVKLLTERIPN